MGKLCVSKWVDNFNNLTPESQLEVASAIRDELHRNNSYPDPEDDYDDLKGIELEEEFAGIRGNLKKILLANITQAEEVKELKSLKGKVEKLGEIEETFKTLSDEEQGIIIDAFISGYNSGMNKVQQRRNEKACAEEGHIWGKWKIEYTQELKEWTMDDFFEGKVGKDKVGKYYYKKVPYKWYNKCTRCGVEATRNYKDVPDEIKEEREKQAAEKAEKKRLKDIETKEKQLVKIKQEINDLKGNKK